MGKKAKDDAKTKASKKTEKSKKAAKSEKAEAVAAETADAQAQAAEAEASNRKPAKPSKSRIRFEGSLAREEAVSYFEAIVAGLKKGTIHFKQGEDALSLDAPAQVDVEVKAARKGEKAKISFELAWKTHDGPDLEIGT